MSAIYGVINLLQNHKSVENTDGWKEYYQKYAIDRIEEVREENFFLGCGIQYITEESRKEELPIRHEEKAVYLTADCIIDNRTELLAQLELADTCPDGRIILAAYDKWGKECVSHLQGLFALAIYDAEQNEVFLAVDQFSQRSLFYHIRDGVLYFSTLLMPILRESGLHFEENSRWLTDCISIRSPMLITEPKETAIDGIFKLVAGTSVIVHVQDGESQNCHLKEFRYYDPVKRIPTDKTITPEQSEHMIRDAVQAAVGKAIRTDGQVGTQLSCGLDSSTVACMAATLLEEKNKQLFSYTSVPLKEAGLKNDGAEIFDETEGVEKIVREHRNIVPAFLDTADRNYLREVDDILAIWELPCKSQQNAIWLDEIYKKAAQDGCKILLSGATGNTNISAGRMEDLFFHNLTHFRFGRAYHALDVLKKMKISRKKVLKYLLRCVWEYYAWYFDKEARDCYKWILTKREVGESFGLTKRFQKQIYHFHPYKSQKTIREEVYLLNQFAQIGEVETKDSLQYGVITRDPFRTVEINELCLRMPLECFVSSDYERRLVRVGMEGIVPQAIRMNLVQRGRQSGDNLYRIKTVWPEMKNEVRKALATESVQKYLVEEKINEYFEKIEKEGPEKNPLEIMMLVDAYSFSHYLELVGEFTSEEKGSINF